MIELETSGQATVATRRPKPGSVAIIGSGFGGSVSALRLAEQGWDVTVLEQGRRLTDADLLAARTDLRAYLWGPGTTGFFWQRVFRHMGIIGANAVGGGSIVWAAVLLEPKPRFFQDTQWPRGTDWQDALKDHYATAARMLGLTVTPESALGLQDEYLEKTAAAMGAHDTFGRVPSAIYYGDGPGVTKRVLRSAKTSGPTAPSYIRQANDATREFARVSGGTPLNLTVESIAGRSFTAHILGGAVMGEDPTTGVVDENHEVFGHPGLYVADASVIPADVGVNPSLTITAMSERFATRLGRPTRRPEPATPTELPTSLPKLAKLWSVLPAPSPDVLEGDWHASFVGPALLRKTAPLGIARAGLPGWLSKRFDAHGRGTNVIHGGRETHLEMTALLAPSAIDGDAVLLVSYDPRAPLPWRHVRDELRALPDGRLLGMSAIKTPGLTRGLPFVLTKVR